MGKFISSAVLTSTLTMSEQSDGFWLYDKTRGMNLSMRAKSSTDAFVEALMYYQTRLSEIETAHASLQSKVDAFVAQFVEESEE